MRFAFSNDTDFRRTWTAQRSEEGATSPTLICGDIVIKFFGHLPSWRRAHNAELSALRCIARGPDVLAPNLLCNGQLAEDSATSWPYLVRMRVPG